MVLITAQLLKAKEVLEYGLSHLDSRRMKGSMFVGVMLDKRIAPIPEKQTALYLLSSYMVMSYIQGFSVVVYPRNAIIFPSPKCH